LTGTAAIGVHALGLVCPAPGVVVPAGQLRHVSMVSCVVPYVPAGHGLRVLRVTLTDAVVLETTRIATHAAAPVASLDVPGGHGTGAPPRPGQYDPAGHVSGDEDPAGQYVPALQFAGGSDALAQNVPTAHVSGADDPAGQYVPGWHDTGTEARATQYDPAGHVSGADDPAGQCVPAGHATWLDNPAGQ